MCELMAISSNISVDPIFIFKKMRKHSSKGKNCDGWGIGFYKGKEAHIFKEPVASEGSKLADKIEKDKIKLRSKIFITHIRDATSGKNTINNTHPFKKELFGTEWLFAHNGTVGKFNEKSNVFKIATKFKPKGQTDSEKAFCYFLDKVKQAGNSEKNFKKRVRLFRQVFKQIKKFGIFNAILSDGKYLYCFGDSRLFYIEKELKKKNLLFRDKEIREGQNHLKHPVEKTIIVSTRPLTTNPKDKWIKIKGLKVFRHGEVVVK